MEEAARVDFTSKTINPMKQRIRQKRYNLKDSESVKYIESGVVEVLLLVMIFDLFK